MKVILLFEMTLRLMLGIIYTSIGRLAYAGTGTTSGNVTAQVQGISLNANSSKDNSSMKR
jgi:hypothetical protein